MFKELVSKNRSYRRFDASYRISSEAIEELIGLARLCPSSRNQQALKFGLVNDTDLNPRVYKTLAWAGYLKDWHGPESEEQPAAYIIVLGDTHLGTKFDIDLGIASQTILLGATEKGFGGCIIASVNREELRKLLNIPDHLEILLVLALGRPAETITIEPMVDGDIKYWRDGNQVHHVPKRSIEEIIWKLKDAD